MRARARRLRRARVESELLPIGVDDECYSVGGAFRANDMKCPARRPVPSSSFAGTYWS